MIYVENVEILKGIILSIYAYCNDSLTFDDKKITSKW